METKLYKTSYDRKIEGVCNGIAERYNVDVSLVRIAFIIGAFAYTFTIILYIALAIILPKKEIR